MSKISLAAAAQSILKSHADLSVSPDELERQIVEWAHNGLFDGFLFDERDKPVDSFDHAFTHFSDQATPALSAQRLFVERVKLTNFMNDDLFQNWSSARTSKRWAGKAKHKPETLLADDQMYEAVEKERAILGRGSANKLFGKEATIEAAAKSLSRYSDRNKNSILASYGRSKRRKKSQEQEQ